MSINSSIFLIFLGLTPSFVWLVFYLHEHFKHPEPKKLIFLTFLTGAVTTFVILPVQLFLNAKLGHAGIGSYSLISFILLAATEELIKFLGVYTVIHQNRHFSEPLDAMIYMITGALGFAAVENIASLFQVANGSLLNVDIIESITLRSVGATLLHSLTSGLVGYYWGLGFYKTEEKGFFIVKGLIIASLLHAVFNWLIIRHGPASTAILFLLFIGFFVLNDFEKFKKLDT